MPLCTAIQYQTIDMTSCSHCFPNLICFSIDFQLVYFGACAPGFLAQFIPFMTYFKIQKVKFDLVYHIVYYQRSVLCINDFRLLFYHIDRVNHSNYTVIDYCTRT